MPNFFTPLRNVIQTVQLLTLADVLSVSISGDLEDLIIELNTEDQLFERNEDSTGVQLSEIGGDYADETLIKKGLSSSQSDQITLKDTGAFYRSFFIKFEGDGFTIEADTIKGSEDLTERWGEDIIGLNSINQDLLVIELIPKVIEFIRRKISQ